MSKTTKQKEAMMTVEDLIESLKSLKSSLRKKEVVIRSENGLLVSPKIKFKLRDEKDSLNLSPENVERIVLC